ncbi:hypothetical protein DCO58_12575 [Helicobacter saguini]|nr:hypothetical protein [Helicobacter saguini]
MVDYESPKVESIELTRQLDETEYNKENKVFLTAIFNNNIESKSQNIYNASKIETLWAYKEIPNTKDFNRQEILLDDINIIPKNRIISNRNINNKIINNIDDNIINHKTTNDKITNNTNTNNNNIESNQSQININNIESNLQYKGESLELDLVTNNLYNYDKQIVVFAYTKSQITLNDKQQKVLRNPAIIDVNKPDCTIKDGYIQGVNIIKKPKPKLVEKTGNFKHKPLAIVLHRTDSHNAQSTLNTWDTSPFGTHFLIDKDGSIYQCASLDKWTQHVGDIRSRVEIEKTWNEKEKIVIEKIWKETSSFKDRKIKVSNYEKKKSYPNRYPISSDSIGIEVVGEYDYKIKRYLNATIKQLESLERLVLILLELYNINKTDIYAHGIIAYKDKNSTEGISLLEYLKGKL